MKLYNKITVAIIAAVSMMLPAFGQHTYSGYFLGNNLYRYEMNPAFGNDSINFVGMPGLGNLNIGMQGTLHLKDIFYNIDGRTSLFTNPAIGVKEAMSKFEDKNRLGMNLKINVLNGGFKAFGGYNTVGINVVAGAELSLPKSFFSLMKEGIANKTYDISNLHARGDAYAEIALGHSHDIKQVPGLRVGGTIKFLLGMASIKADFKNANLNLGENDWSISSNADLYAAMKGMKFKMKYNEDNNTQYVDGLDMNGFGINGFGLGFNLGASYKYRDFSFSLAFLDLGFMNWGDAIHATTNGVKTFNTDKYAFDITGHDKEDGESTFDRMRDDISKLYQLEASDAKGMTNSLNTTMNIGIDYKLPYYRRLSFGLLNSTTFYGPYTWTQFRLSANVMPVDIFSASANVAVGTFGWDFGWMLNLRLKKGFSMFVGMDHTLGTLSKQYIPLNSNAKFNLGIDFPF